MANPPPLPGTWGRCPAAVLSAAVAAVAPTAAAVTLPRPLPWQKPLRYQNSDINAIQKQNNMGVVNSGNIWLSISNIYAKCAKNDKVDVNTFCIAILLTKKAK